MSDLRMILLLIGVGIILAVYFWTRSQQTSRRSASKTRATASRTSVDEPDAEDIQAQLVRMEQLVADRDEELAGEEGEHSGNVDRERLLVISVVAPEGEPFEGEALLKAFAHNRLQFNDSGIYQRILFRDGQELALFGIANLVKPGIFDPSSMSSFTTPGITLFLQLPCAVTGEDAFDDFVKTAERLAVELGGELRDERHALLTHQVLMQTREGIVAARFRPVIAS